MTDILSICEHYPAPALDTALNFLSTHDTERALTVIADEPANGRGREWQSGRCVTGDATRKECSSCGWLTPSSTPCPASPASTTATRSGCRLPRPLQPRLLLLGQPRRAAETCSGTAGTAPPHLRAFRTGELRVLRAEGGVLHYQRIGEFEAAEIIVNRTEHIIVEPLASGKHTEVNPMGFTIVVEEVGHNPDHSYYDYK